MACDEVLFAQTPKNCDIFQTPISYSKSKYFSSQQKLSKPQLNQNSTQPQRNITLVGLDMKMTLQATPPPHKLDVNYISADTDPVLMKL